MISNVHVSQLPLSCAKDLRKESSRAQRYLQRKLTPRKAVFSMWHLGQCLMYEGFTFNNSNLDNDIQTKYQDDVLAALEVKPSPVLDGVYFIRSSYLPVASRSHLDTTEALIVGGYGNIWVIAAPTGAEMRVLHAIIQVSLKQIEERRNVVFNLPYDIHPLDNYEQVLNYDIALPGDDGRRQRGEIRWRKAAIFRDGNNYQGCVCWQNNDEPSYVTAGILQQHFLEKGGKLLQKRPVPTIQHKSGNYSAILCGSHRDDKRVAVPYSNNKDFLDLLIKKVA